MAKLKASLGLVLPPLTLPPPALSSCFSISRIEVEEIPNETFNTLEAAETLVQLFSQGGPATKPALQLERLAPVLAEESCEKQCPVEYRVEKDILPEKKQTLAWLSTQTVLNADDDNVCWKPIRWPLRNRFALRWESRCRAQVTVYGLPVPDVSIPTQGPTFSPEHKRLIELNKRRAGWDEVSQQINDNGRVEEEREARDFLELYGPIPKPTEKTIFLEGYGTTPETRIACNHVTNRCSACLHIPKLSMPKSVKTKLIREAEAVGPAWIQPTDEVELFPYQQEACERAEAKKSAKQRKMKEARKKEEKKEMARRRAKQCRERKKRLKQELLLKENPQTRSDLEKVLDELTKLQRHLPTPPDSPEVQFGDAQGAFSLQQLKQTECGSIGKIMAI